MENTENIDNPSRHDAADSRPLGYWLRTVDAYITREFARALDEQDVSRRDWMLLNVVAGDVQVPGFAERLARKGKRLRGLEERGWVAETGDGTWILTDEGRAAKERLGGIVDGIRSRVAGAVSPEDFATTLASLEAIARELGWNENERTPWTGSGHGFGPGPFGPGAFGPGAFGPGVRRGFGPGGRRGFGRGFTPEDAERFAERFAEHFGGHLGGDFRRHFAEHAAHHGERQGAHDHGDPRGHGHKAQGHGHRGDARSDAQSAYERGFDAGFARGRTDS